VIAFGHAAGGAAVDDEDLAGLIARAKSGDGEAARELQRFEDDIRMLVRVRLPRALRSKFDSMDFVQSVWESFLSSDHEPGQLKDIKNLRGYLAGIARNKVLEEHRRTKSRKYEIAREEPLYIRKGDREFPREVAASDPTPSEDAQAHDRLQQLIAGRSPEEAEVILLRSRGLSNTEIAAQVGLSERTVRRIIESVRHHFEDLERP
jgi:RNA polymerase sigma-70 factor (ECF subfamily)